AAQDRPHGEVQPEARRQVPHVPHDQCQQAQALLRDRQHHAGEAPVRQPRQVERGRRMKWSFRTWLSIFTGVILVVLVITLWPEIEKAFAYLGQVNLWILALLIPAQILSYIATGEVLFSYLRRRGTLRGL